MTEARRAVNILHRYDIPLFTPHFDPARDGFDVVENGDDDRVWDLVLVFEAIGSVQRLRVRENGIVFVSGEPPEIGNHSRQFLRQFDAVFCAGAPEGIAPVVSHEQHFNNWHFGYSGQSGYRYGHDIIRALALPEKTKTISTITSNLSYLPMHIKRRALIDRLARDYPRQIDIFGRPHRYVEYKEDAILPYQFHLCIENCSVPDLWTEKIADALLGYAVPIYAGCPNIERYFPGATIAIDLNDYASARRTIDTILSDGATIYQDRLPAIVSARRRLIETFDISALVASSLRRTGIRDIHNVALRPEASFPMAGVRDLVLRARRKAVTLLWKRKIGHRG